MVSTITPSNIHTVKVYKTFSRYGTAVRCLNFSPSGEFLVCCNSTDHIMLYDCIDFKLRAGVKCSALSIFNLQFANSDDSVIHSNVRHDNNVRHLNLETRTVVNEFKGHTDTIGSVAMAPMGTAFISAAGDKTMRFWDLRTPAVTAHKELPYGHIIVTYDNTANIVAASVESHLIYMFDTRFLDKGPFMALYIGGEKTCRWIKKEFSHDNSTILLSTTGDIIRTVDALDSGTLQSVAGRINANSVRMESRYSPESRYIFTCSSSGLLHAWDFQNGIEVCDFRCSYSEDVQCLEFNPKFNLLAAAGWDIDIFNWE